jgi:hypothetical protein
LLGLALYVPLRSIQWDLNGIIEAQSVDAGGARLFSPNHLLYRPLGRAVVGGVRRLGSEATSAAILQIFTAVAAAVGVGSFYLVLHGVTRSLPAAWLGTALLAVSWSYWKFSVDVSYIAPAALAVSAALLVLLRPEHTRRSAAASGLAIGLGILSWQANVFLLPLACWRLLRHGTPRLACAAVGLGVCATVVGTTYAAVAALGFGRRTPVEILAWVTAHGSDFAGRAPMWGKWGPDRLAAAATSAVASFVPVWQGLGLRRLLSGDPDPGKLLGQLSLLALVLMATWTAMRALRRPFRSQPGARAAVELFLAYAAYWPFIVWWEPYETRWFVIPNLLLIAGMASAWTTVAAGNALRLARLGLGIAVIGAANFTSTIWPYHTVANPRLGIAECFARHATEADAFVPTDWNWLDYATYLFGYRGRIVWLERGATAGPGNTERLAEALKQARRSGGQVYVTDLTSYTPEERAYVVNQIGVPLEVVERFAQEPAFGCSPLRFMRLVGVAE